MKTFETTRAAWPESFGQIAERLWAAKHGPRKGNIASLHRQIMGIGYEGFRKMIDGQVMPRKDIMEQVAGALEINPREFPEYRLLEIHEACMRHPEIDQLFYEQIMEAAARLDEKADARHAGKKSSFEMQRGREPSGAADK